MADNSCMKIGVLLPVDWVKGQPVGGPSRTITNVLPYLQANVYLLGLEVKEPMSGKPERIEDIENVRNAPLFQISYPSPIPVRVKALLGYWRAKGKVADMGLDVLYAHTPESAFPFLLGEQGAPVVYQQHGASNPIERSAFSWARNRFFVTIFDWMTRFVYRRAQAVIAVDKLGYDRATASGAAGKTVLIPNPVDVERFRPNDALKAERRKRYGYSPTDKIILYAGRLSKGKGLHLMIRAIDLARQHGQEWSFVVAGEGELREQLQRQVEDLGVEDRVQLLGRVSYDDIPAMYNMADLTVLPSKEEGLPMMVLESLACGTPVVATPVGAVPEVVEHGSSGILLKERTSKGLLAGVEEAFSTEWEGGEIRESIAPWASPQISERIQETLFEADVQAIKYVK